MLSKKLIKGKPDNPPTVPVSAPAPVVPVDELAPVLDAPAKKEKKDKKKFLGLSLGKKKKKKEVDEKRI